MKVDTMRWIDRRVGAPLCALATPLVRLWHFVLARPLRPAPRLLFVELSEMGSTILAEPAMRKARDDWARSYSSASSPQRRLARSRRNDLPANIFTIRDTSLLHLAWDTLGFLIWTRRKGIDTVVDLEFFSRFTACSPGFRGLPPRGFLSLSQRGSLSRRNADTSRRLQSAYPYCQEFHRAGRCALGRDPTVPYSKTLIDDSQIEPPVIRPAAAARETVLARVRQSTGFDPATQRLVLINPNASELLPQRRWMPDRYGDLIRRVIAGHGDVIVLVTGAPEEQAEAETLAAACGARCFSFAGKTTLVELPALYSHAAAMVRTIPGRPISLPRRGCRPLCCSARKRRNSTSRSERPRQSMRGSPARLASARTITVRPRAMTMSACVPSASNKSMRRSPSCWRGAVDRVAHS